MRAVGNGESLGLGGVTVAVDAMGGDKAPAEIVAGALKAAEELGVKILLVGQSDAIEACLPEGKVPAGVEIFHASEVIAMHDDAAASVRNKKDSSLVRCAEAVRDGRAGAMVSAGNTGATMASALLRCGRIKGVSRPCIATPIPVMGSHFQLLVDAGATVDCQPEWLVQFARMGSVYAAARLGVAAPSVGLLSNGEEAGKGDDLRKKTYSMMQRVPGFVGNVEGRDFASKDVDVIVTDGFTGNVALKSLEKALKVAMKMVFETFGIDDETKAAGDVLLPHLIEAATVFDPDETGGAVLLGINGVCIISHGSSTAKAIVNAVRVGADAVTAGVVDQIAHAIATAES